MDTAKYTRFLSALMLCLGAFSVSSHAHDQPVHRRISQAAADLANNLPLFLKANYTAPAQGDVITLLQFKNKDQNLTVRSWLAEGAYDEDSPAIRSKNHFYDPIPNPGAPITDASETFGILGNPVSSWVWATTRNNNGNIYTWQNARDYLYSALTAPSRTQRDESMGLCLYSVGHVMHLNQDLSQPGHTRNDNHRSKHYIESYGSAHIDSLPFSGNTALDWKAVGFVKLQDFWDRNLYTGNSASALDSDSGTATLGLAEFSNGNFLSEDSLYAESTLGIHHYTYPSLITGTNFNTIKSNFSSSARQVLLNNGTTVTRFYVSKIADGIHVERHAAMSYLGVRSSRQFGSLPSYGVSINDPSVLAEYHSIIIPKAVSYSAGIIDYFFRGKLDIRLTWNKDNNAYKISATNNSGQPLNGGAFELYSETDSGTRASVSFTSNSWTSGSSLADGSSTDFEFQPASGSIASYTLIYKGTIGNSGDDPIDEGLAIAAHRFQILRFNTTWSPHSDIDLYLVDPDGNVIYYGSKQQDSGELDYDDIPGTGPENITLKQLNDGDYQVWVNYYNDNYHEDEGDGNEDPPPPPTQISVTLKTYFNTTAELDSVTFTLTQDNYGGSRPYGTTGPNTQSSWYIRKLVTVKNGVLTQH